MRTHSGRILSLALAALALASGAAGAQGKGHGKGHEKAEKAERKAERDLRASNGVVVRDRDVYGNRVNTTTKVPPGLAKKPGQMPPGQYKKRYGTSEGADVLGGILRRRGYSVIRVVPAGDSRYVYYRTADGLERRAIVSPGTDRLSFTNVPAALLQEVLARLY
jgi:hypothetical protein